MANGNFIVQNGLQIGPLTIDAATGGITTTGNVTTTGTITTFINEIVTGTEAVYGQLSANAGIGSLSTTTGTFVVTGGAGITGDVYVGGNLHTTGTAYLKIPAGTTAQRPGSANVALGMIRYNSSISSFEGYGAGSAWSSLGGVKSVDGYATITAEASAGAGDDVLRFYSGSTGSSVQAMWASASNVSILPTTTSTSTTTGALQVAGGVGVSGNLNIGGTSTFSGNVNPSANVTYSLGSKTMMWKDLYVGPGTLYINGKAVLQDNSGTITVSTTAGQNLQMATSGGGTIQLTTNGGGGVIAVQGPLQVAAGNNITSSDGNPIQFANAIGIDTISTHTNNTNLSLSAQGTGKIAINNSITGGGTVTFADTTATSSTSTGAVVVAGGVGVAGDLRVAGNVYSYGVLAVQSSTLEVSAPMVYLQATSSGYPYSYDIGTYSHFVGGSANVYQHTGFVRSQANGYWGLFANVASEPTTTVNWSDPNLTWDSIKTGNHIIANTTVSSSTTTGALQVAGGAGIAGAVYAGSVNTGSGAITTTGTVSATTLTGTLSTAAQTNITSVGTLTSLAVTGALSSGSFTVPTASQPNITSVGTLTGLTVSGTIAASTNNTINIGASGTTFATVYATTFSGVSTTAKYADLAENYQGDKSYSPGTVVMFGGSAEVTLADADTTAVAGVVSTNPAHLMNGGLTGANVVPLALQGRVPCNVIGPVKKGDMMVSAGFGFAKTNNLAGVGQVIGKALQDVTFAGKAVIEVVVGRV